MCVVFSGTGVPVEDQQLAVALLVELAIQQGSLSAMLGAVRLLLTVSSDVDVDRDNRLSTVLTHAPLVPVLRRFQALALASEASDGGDVNEVIFFVCFFILFKLIDCLFSCTHLNYLFIHFCYINSFQVFDCYARLVFVML